MKIHHMEQRSVEWYAIKKGVASASSFEKILTPTGALSKSRLSYMRKLAREAVADDPTEGYDNKHMEWGRKFEPEAVAEYELITGSKVDSVGFVTSSFSDYVGCSPDGLCLTNGLEIKAPAVDTHVKYLMEGILPKEYRLQVHGSLIVCELDRYDFMSYFPNLEPFIIEVVRDEFTDKLEAELKQFAKEFEAVREDIIKAITPKERF